jgi:hypothetical protein
MPRERGNTAEVDVDTNAEVEDVSGATETTESTPKTPARPPVPEGFVTPVGFAKLLTAHLREREPEHKEIPPQQIYSMIRNASKENPFPVYEEGGRKNLIKAQEGLAWWDAKDQRVAERKANAAAKAEKKAAAAAQRESAGESGGDTAQAVEAE